MNSNVILNQTNGTTLVIVSTQSYGSWLKIYDSDSDTYEYFPVVMGTYGTLTGFMFDYQNPMRMMDLGSFTITDETVEQSAALVFDPDFYNTDTVFTYNQTAGAITGLTDGNQYLFDVDQTGAVHWYQMAPTNGVNGTSPDGDDGYKVQASGVIPSDDINITNAYKAAAGYASPADATGDFNTAYAVAADSLPASSTPDDWVTPGTYIIHESEDGLTWNLHEATVDPDGDVIPSDDPMALAWQIDAPLAGFADTSLTVVGASLAPTAAGQLPIDFKLNDTGDGFDWDYTNSSAFIDHDDIYIVVTDGTDYYEWKLDLDTVFAGGDPISGTTSFSQILLASNPTVTFATAFSTASATDDWEVLTFVDWWAADGLMATYGDDEDGLALTLTKDTPSTLVVDAVLDETSVATDVDPSLASYFAAPTPPTPMGPYIVQPSSGDNAITIGNLTDGQDLYLQLDGVGGPFTYNAPDITTINGAYAVTLGAITNGANAFTTATGSSYTLHVLVDNNDDGNLDLADRYLTKDLGLFSGALTGTMTDGSGQMPASWSDGPVGGIEFGVSAGLIDVTGLTDITSTDSLYVVIKKGSEGPLYVAEQTLAGVNTSTTVAFSDLFNGTSSLSTASATNNEVLKVLVFVDKSGGTTTDKFDAGVEQGLAKQLTTLGNTGDSLASSTFSIAPGSTSDADFSTYVAGSTGGGGGEEGGGGGAVTGAPTLVVEGWQYTKLGFGITSFWKEAIGGDPNDTTVTAQRDFSADPEGGTTASPMATVHIQMSAEDLGISLVNAATTGVQFRLGGTDHPNGYELVTATWNGVAGLYEYQGPVNLTMGPDGTESDITVQAVLGTLADGVTPNTVGMPVTETVAFDFTRPEAQLSRIDDATALNAGDTMAIYTSVSPYSEIYQIDYSEFVHINVMIGWPLDSEIESGPNIPGLFVEPLIKHVDGLGEDIGAAWYHTDSGWFAVPESGFVLGDARFDSVIFATDSQAKVQLMPSDRYISVTESAPVVTTNEWTKKFTLEGEGTAPRTDDIAFGVDAHAFSTVDNIYFRLHTVSYNDLTKEWVREGTIVASSAGEISSDDVAFLDEYFDETSIRLELNNFSVGQVADDAGNPLDGNRVDPDVVISEGAPDTVFYAPETGTGGGARDTLDLTGLTKPVQVWVDYGEVVATNSTGTTVVYSIADFGAYAISGSGNLFTGPDGDGVTVFVKGTGSGNVIEGGDAETDGVVYGDTSTGLTVDLSETSGTVPDSSLDWVVVARGAGGYDYIHGVENFTGSSVADTITGSAATEILMGAGGGDTIDGNGGGDLLAGGGGATDELTGSTGAVDILVDLDGGILQGRDTPWVKGETQDASDHDVFIVREGATIKNFALSTDQTDLSGRSHLAADRVTFALNTAQVVAAALFAAGSAADMTEAKNMVAAANFDRLAHAQDIEDFIADDLVVGYELDGADLILTVKGPLTAEHPTGVWASATLQGIGLALAGNEVEPVRLDKYAATAFDTIEYATRKLSEGAVNPQDVAKVTSSFLNNIALAGQEILIPVALESVEAGTVSSSKPGLVMASEVNGFLETEAQIFVPGFGDQDLIGGRGNDTYRFVPQDFTLESGGVAGDAGRDTVIDVGGNDNVFLGAATIDDIHLEAFRAGRERDANSLRIEWTQKTGVDAENTLENSGQIEWRGAFRDGGMTRLESVEVGVDAESSGLIENDEGTVVYSIARADHGAEIFDPHQVDTDDDGELDAAYDTTISMVDAGRTFVADVAQSDNWIVAGTKDEADIVRVEGIQAEGSATELRIWGFDVATDVLDVSAWVEANTRFFTDSDSNYANVSDQSSWETWNASFDDNVKQVDGGFQIFRDAVQQYDPADLVASIYFMDNTEDLNNLMLFTG